MNVDWAADVKKYVPDADDGAIAGIVRHCGIALHSRDASLVSFTDPTETDLVRESFLKRKLGLTQSDSELDAVIAGVGHRMSGEHFRNRVTVYYLLADHFGMLHRFIKAGPADNADAAPEGDTETKPASAGFGAAAALGAGVAGTAALAGGAVSGAGEAVSGLGHAASDGAHGILGAVGAGVAGTAALAGGAVSGAVSGAGEAIGGVGHAAVGAVGGAVSGVTGAVGAGVEHLHGAAEDIYEPVKHKRGWLMWLLLGLALLALLLWLFGCQPKAAQTASSTASSAAVPGAVASADAATAASGAASGAASSAAASAAASDGAESASAVAENGAGVTTETRDGKPLVKVFFRSGSAWLVPAFKPAAETLKTYLAAHAGAKLTVSGFADKTGNADINAAISKERAKRVKDALVADGIAEGAVALVKPADSVDATDATGAARRVEGSVQ